MVSLRRQGASDPELLLGYPGLTQADLKAAWEYYAANPAEIEATVRENDEVM